MSLSYEVRNRVGRVVHTFNTPDLALEFAAGKAALFDGVLTAHAVETIRRERLLTAEPEIAQARAARAGRRG